MGEISEKFEEIEQTSFTNLLAIRFSREQTSPPKEVISSWPPSLSLSSPFLGPV